MFEHLFEYVDGDESVQEQMNKRSKEGWELVNGKSESWGRPGELRFFLFWKRPEKSTHAQEWCDFHQCEAQCCAHERH